MKRTLCPWLGFLSHSPQRQCHWLWKELTSSPCSVHLSFRSPGPQVCFMAEEGKEIELCVREKQIGSLVGACLPLSPQRCAHWGACFTGCFLVLNKALIPSVKFNKSPLSSGSVVTGCFFPTVLFQQLWLVGTASVFGGEVVLTLLAGRLVHQKGGNHVVLPRTKPLPWKAQQTGPRDQRDTANCLFHWEYPTQVLHWQRCWWENSS